MVADVEEERKETAFEAAMRLALRNSELEEIIRKLRARIVRLEMRLVPVIEERPCG